MANALGIGMPSMTSSRGVAAPPPVAPRPAPPDPATLEALAMLARVVWLLGSSAQGLTATELRALLDEPIDRVQRGLAEGLRTRRLRRVGARRNVRYLLNA